MTDCSHCGGRVLTAMEACPHCGQSLADVGTDAGSGDDEESAGDGEKSLEYRNVSRREMLAYGGGSAVATWAAAGAGWFAFIYEQTGPEEDVVREYVSALDRSHFYTASQLFHENAPGEAWTAEELPDVDQVDLSVEEAEVTDREEDVDIDGVQELALVVAEISMETSLESQTMEVAFVVALNEDGEWKLWRDR
ncbi:hypothetical protein BRC65_05630 [Halobacteriales archaeon QH_2_65_14]|nr:MAG: hypothetical protein BRC65_05630 [Halobacteriales archaeon QH_2_65_14]